MTHEISNLFRAPNALNVCLTFEAGILRTVIPCRNRAMIAQMLTAFTGMLFEKAAQNRLEHGDTHGAIEYKMNEVETRATPTP